MLIAILLPALGKAREASKRMQCLSNLRGIMVSSASYSADSNDWFMPVYPEYHYNDSSGLPTLSWAQSRITRGYLGYKPADNSGGSDAQPAVTCPKSYASANTNSWNGEANMHRSYGGNFTDFITWGTPNYLWQNPVSARPHVVGYTSIQILSPAKKLAFADALDGGIRESSSPNYDGEHLPATNTQTAYRHDNSLNVSYYDGHSANSPREVIDSSYLTTQQIDDLWFVYPK